MTRLAMVLALGAMVSSPFALATPLSTTRLGNPIPKSTPMRLGPLAVAPIAAIRFCMDHAGECQGGELETVALTEERWAELEAVNQAVNAAIAPRPDGAIDTWSLGALSGDCDDYAVEKRHRLIARGWARGAVSLAVARINGGELHLVTVVATDQGDYVLDNRTAAVRPWRRTGYRWLMRSQAGDPRLWQAVGGAAEVPRHQSASLPR